MPYKSLSPSLDIIEFWFSPEVQPFWFIKDTDFDETVHQRFNETYLATLSHFKEGNLEGIQDGRSALALVVTLDQIPRNMFRDKPEAFASDSLALKISQYAVEKEMDQQLSLTPHYNFLYMPFMHSENLDDQEEGIRLFSSISGNEQTVGYARHHRDIIAQFGRFPHRNVILGRPSTPEETKFLGTFQGF